MTTPTPEQIIAAMQALDDGLRALIEVASGYRRQLIEQGWPEVIADQLSAAVLAGLQQQLFNGQR